MECCFTARELVITRSRLQWNAAKVTTDHKDEVMQLQEAIA